MNNELATALPGLVGKTIAHIVVKEGSAPRAQLFLIFTDGTSYEFFSSDAIEGCARIDPRGLSAVPASDARQQVVFQC
jgi:hypothetical protein